MILGALNDSLRQGSRSKGLIIYFFKLLRQGGLTTDRIVVANEVRLSLITVMPWLSQLNLLDLASYRRYQL